MKQLERVAHNINKNRFSGLLCVFIVAVKTDFRKLYIPVAEHIPNEVVELLNGKTELIFFKRVRNCLDKVVILRQYPLVLNSKIFGNVRSLLVLAEVHKDKPCRIPNLVCKVSACLNLFVGKSHIISGAVARGKGKSQCVCAELVDNFKRINTVAERLRHFSALCVTDKSVNKHRIKRSLTCIFKRREYHS